MLPASTDGKECTLYTHNGTKAFIRHLHKASYHIIHPRRFARNASHCFWRKTTQPHPKQSYNSCSSCKPHLMGYGPGRLVKTCGRPHGRGGRRTSSGSCKPHLMGYGPGRPVKTCRPPHGPGGAAHIEPTSHGPRPGPAHQISRGWTAARPGPSKFQRMGRGPAQPIRFSNFHGPARPGPSDFQKSRPGPAHHISKRLGPARPGPSQFSDRPGPARSRQTAHDKP